MNLTKDRFGGLLFLLVSATYGYYAADIPLLPGDKFEPFHAQTMPYWLSSLGIFFSFLLIGLKLYSLALVGFSHHYKYFFSLKLLAVRRA